MKKIAGLAVFMFVFLSSCARSDSDSARAYPVNVGSFANQGNFKIDSEKILSDLNRGVANVFQSVEEVPNTKLFSEQFEWSQADYEKITTAVFQFVWNDSINSWIPYRFDFGLHCQDEPKGFNYVDLFYYQEIENDNKPFYSVRAISIIPQSGFIAWGGGTNFPRPFPGWGSIKQDELKVSAEEALGVAESKGGQSFRLARKNACSISVYMYPQAYNYGGWIVTYSTGDIYLPDFEIRISEK